MNRFFKTIWKPETQSFAVTSKLTRAKGKASPMTKSHEMKLSSITLALFGAIGLLANPAVAVDNTQGSGTETTSIAVGPTSKTTDAKNAIAIGSNAAVNQATGTSATNAIAVGNNASINIYQSAYDAASKSKKSRYTGMGSIAAGSNATVYGSHSIATGENATASGWKATAIGAYSTVEGDSSVAIGDTAKTLAGTSYGNPSSGGAVAIGQEAQTVTQGSVAVGGKSKASGWRSTAVGWQSQALTESAVALGNQALADGWGAMALGTIAKAYGYNAAAVGNDAYAYGTYASSFGTNSHAYSDDTKGHAGALAVGANTAAVGNRATSVGYNVYTTGNNAVSIGSSSAKHQTTPNASGDYSVTLGHDTSATATDSMSFGRETQATATSAIAMGAQSTANIEGSVALGNQSTTTAGVNTNNATVGALTYSGFAGSTASSVVSVGTATYQRQIQNVAAGQINNRSTDAINGSQLYAVMATLGNVTSSLVTVLGGNAAISSDGTISMTNIGDTGENTIHDAIKKGGSSSGGTSTVVKAGKNISVTQSGNTYTVATNDDMAVNSITAGDTVINNNGVTINGGPSMTKDGINAGNQRITNVAPGINGTDAVNMNQLNEVRQDVNGLKSHVHKMDRKLRAGIAGALASGGLYHATKAGKSMVSIGGGTYNGESAVAVGYSRLSDNAKWGVKVSVNNDTRSNFGAAASVGYQF